MCDTTPIGLTPTTEMAAQSTSAGICQSVLIPPVQLSRAEPSLGALKPKQVCWPVSRTESPNRRIRVLEEKVCLTHSNIATFILPSVETTRTYSSGKVQARLLWFSLKQTCLSGYKWLLQAEFKCWVTWTSEDVLFTPMVWCVVRLQGRTQVTLRPMSLTYDHPQQQG